MIFSLSIQFVLYFILSFSPLSFQDVDFCYESSDQKNLSIYILVVTVSNTILLRNSKYKVKKK